MNEAEFLDKFNQFEEIDIQDPYTASVIEQALELEAALNVKPYEEMTEFERLDIKLFAKDYIEMMNRECPYYNQEVSVTGRMMTAAYDDFKKEYSVTEQAYTDYYVTAKGYFLLLAVDDSEQLRYTVGHDFIAQTLPAQAAGPLLVDFIPVLHSFARVGSVDVTADLPDQRHGGMLYNLIPEIVDRVNHQVSQASDPVDALRRLRHVVITDGENMPKSTTNDLLNYTYECLGLDEDVPYVVQLRGAVYQDKLTSAGGAVLEQHDKASEPLLVSPRELRLSQYPTIKEEGCELDDYDHFFVKLHVLNDENGSGEREILAPVRNIKSMQSLRDFVPQQLGKKPSA